MSENDNTFYRVKRGSSALEIQSSSDFRERTSDDFFQMAQRRTLNNLELMRKKGRINENDVSQSIKFLKVENDSRISLNEDRMDVDGRANIRPRSSSYAEAEGTPTKRTRY